MIVNLNFSRPSFGLAYQAMMDYWAWRFAIAKPPYELRFICFGVKDDYMIEENQKGLFSLLRDNTSRATLEKFMIAHGVDPLTANDAATRCEQAAFKNGALGTSMGALLGLFATSPVAGIGAAPAALIGLTFGSGGTLLFSEKCKQIRDAAFDISSSN